MVEILDLCFEAEVMSLLNKLQNKGQGENSMGFLHRFFLVIS